MGWTHQKTISLLVNLAVNSLRLKSITVQEQAGPFQLRTQMHVILQAAKSSTKSTILDSVAGAAKVPVYTSMSWPGLVGSIDKETKQYVPAAAWDARNKPLLMDEWDSGDEKKELIGALLQLTEGGRYGRRIARWCAPTELKDGELFASAKDGELLLKTRFALVLATMMDVTGSTSAHTQALVSRAIPYRFKLSEEEIERALQGHSFYKPETWSFEPDAKINIKTYSKLIVYSRASPLSIRARVVGDLCRAYAMLGWRPEVFDEIIAHKSGAELRCVSHLQTNARSRANLEMSPNRQKLEAEL